mmetsp:Transcript_87473/g.155138  ORF Transcript_87473/g.155138 Transcript_87473/m.155138 type:complete len:205 (+) Transcript_87473:207-821(+)
MVIVVAAHSATGPNLGPPQRQLLNRVLVNVRCVQIQEGDGGVGVRVKDFPIQAVALDHLCNLRTGSSLLHVVRPGSAPVTTVQLDCAQVLCRCPGSKLLDRRPRVHYMKRHVTACDEMSHEAGRGTKVGPNLDEETRIEACEGLGVDLFPMEPARYLIAGHVRCLRRICTLCDVVLTEDYSCARAQLHEHCCRSEQQHLVHSLI